MCSRVRNLNKVPEIRDKVYDPDPGKAYTKAKLAKLEGDEDISNMTGKHELNQFPSDDSIFSQDYSIFPAFLPTDTLDHLKNCGKTTKKCADDVALVELSSSKGLRLLPFVHDLEVYKHSDSNIVYLRALCWASYRKSVKHKVKMIISSNGKPKIMSAQCDKICPAGKSGCCCHVMAVIWKLDDITRKKEAYKPTDDRACTSKPRKWGIPSRRKVDHKPVMESSIFKPRHESDIPGRKRRGVLPTFYDPRPVKSRRLDPQKVESLRNEVRKVSPSIPFSKMTPNSDDITLVDSIVGMIAKGSVLALQLKDYNNASGPVEDRSPLVPLPFHSVQCNNHNTELSDHNDTLCSGNDQTNECRTFPIISPPKHHPVSLDEISERCKKIKGKLSVDENEIVRIEKETEGQSDNPKWFEHRFGRVTASKSHRIACQHRPNTSPTKIIKDILNYNPHIQTKAMKEGIKNESQTLSLYEASMQQQGKNGFKVEKCGFFVSGNHGFIGASPDGLVTDPSAENPHGIVEIKNMQVRENESLLVALNRQSVCNKQGDLKTSHKYYYQMQQQLYVLSRPWCDFVVRGSNGELFNKRVKYNPAWWNAVFQRLESFYDLYVLPELAYPRVRDGLKRYDFQERLL